MQLGPCCSWQPDFILQGSCSITVQGSNFNLPASFSGWKGSMNVCYKLRLCVVISKFCSSAFFRELRNVGVQGNFTGTKEAPRCSGASAHPLVATEQVSSSCSVPQASPSARVCWREIKNDNWLNNAEEWKKTQWFLVFVGNRQIICVAFLQCWKESSQKVLQSCLVRQGFNLMFVVEHYSFFKP